MSHWAPGLHKWFMTQKHSSEAQSSVSLLHPERNQCLKTSCPWSQETGRSNQLIFPPAFYLCWIFRCLYIQRCISADINLTQWQCREAHGSERKRLWSQIRRYVLDSQTIFKTSSFAVYKNWSVCHESRAISDSQSVKSGRNGCINQKEEKKEIERWSRGRRYIESVEKKKNQTIFL